LDSGKSSIGFWIRSQINELKKALPESLIYSDFE